MATLSAAKLFMENRGRASVAEIATALDTTPDVARSLLEIWRTKKKARRVIGMCAACGESASCACACAGGADLTDVYEWVETQKNSAAQ
ncbi:MAG: FeoC-like transcriptional regulator [Methylocystis sp.]|uniref:FeoC-like transcriptional regulator n=1 Tax=Methylocystis sp. TaxID=1911079 RepID=UPI003D0E0AA6